MNTSRLKSFACATAIICFIWPRTWPVGLWLGGFILLALGLDWVKSFYEDQDSAGQKTRLREAIKETFKGLRNAAISIAAGLGLICLTQIVFWLGAALSWSGVVDALLAWERFLNWCYRHLSPLKALWIFFVATALSVLLTLIWPKLKLDERLTKTRKLISRTAYALAAATSFTFFSSAVPVSKPDIEALRRNPTEIINGSNDSQPVTGSQAIPKPSEQTSTSYVPPPAQPSPQPLPVNPRRQAAETALAQIDQDRRELVAVAHAEYALRSLPQKARAELVGGITIASLQAEPEGAAISLGESVGKTLPPPRHILSFDGSNETIADQNSSDESIGEIKARLNDSAKQHYTPSAEEVRICEQEAGRSETVLKAARESLTETANHVIGSFLTEGSGPLIKPFLSALISSLTKSTIGLIYPNNISSFATARAWVRKYVSFKAGPELSIDGVKYESPSLGKGLIASVRQWANKLRSETQPDLEPGRYPDLHPKIPGYPDIPGRFPRSEPGIGLPGRFGEPPYLPREIPYDRPVTPTRIEPPRIEPPVIEVPVVP